MVWYYSNRNCFPFKTIISDLLRLLFFIRNSVWWYLSWISQDRSRIKSKFVLFEPSKRTNFDLILDRSCASFDLEEMAHLLDGGPNRIVKRGRLQDIMENYSTYIFSNEENNYLIHIDRYVRAVTKVCNYLNCVVDLDLPSRMIAPSLMTYYYIMTLKHCSMP